MARPTDYTDEYLNKSKEYISSCIDDIEEYHKTRGDRSDTYDRLVRVKIPTLEGLAVYLEIARSTLYEWRDSISEFSDIIDQLQAIQADRLLNNGLSGDYNPTIAKVLLSKHGYRDSQELTGKDGEKLTFNIISFDEYNNPVQPKTE